jgi:TonB family protein
MESDKGQDELDFVGPNHALQRSRPSRYGCNRRVWRARSLSLGLVRSMSRALFLSLTFMVGTAVVLAQPSPEPSSNHKRMAIYAPAPKVPSEARAKHLAGSGVCMVYIRPDGIVSRAEMIQSTGQSLLDQASIDAYSKWRFVPGAIKKGKAKIPITYTGNYTKPPQT